MDKVIHSVVQYKTIWLIAPYVSLLTFLILNPWLRPDPHQAIGMVTWDVLDHAVAYGLLAFLLLSVLMGPAQKLSSTLLAVLLSSVFGFMLELGQLWFSSVRSFSFFDAYANVVGSCLGVGAFWCFRLTLPMFRVDGN